MSYRAISIALLAALLSTSAIAQGGGSAGGASSGGAAGGAPGSMPSGTAGVSPSTSNPGVGTPGTPGPSTGAGIPGGPGPGNTAVVPNQPSPPTSNPTVGRASGSNVGSPVAPTSTAGSGSPAAQSRVYTTGNTQPDNNFHPEAVTDGALDTAANDIAAMTTSELRSLLQLFKTCTANEHPLERVGKCGAVSRLHRSKYAKGRQFDRSLAELERVVRFQNMFRTSRVPSTEYEDRINNRLRTSARLALATNELRERQARESGAPPDLTRDVRMAK